VHRARVLWHRIEAIHAVLYFDDEPRMALTEAGLRGFWMGYFAGRSAPMGAVDAPVVTATFFNFHPMMVQRSIPDAWTLSSPEKVIGARRSSTIETITRLVPDAAAQAEELVPVLEFVVGAAPEAGRPLFAANRAIDAGDDPVARLWQAATLLREHRGDGHVAALVSAELDGCEVQVLRSALDSGREILQPNRGWSDEDWESAGERLAERGLLSANGRATTAGAEEIRSVEYTTNRSAARPWAALGTEQTEHLMELLRPITRACATELPAEFPVGLPPAEVIAST